ncbi:MAG: CocE/NonD family hydrolase, partial [Clostridia bacterium]|nr:CocE/NonD family hydrolase [Clostridia bacterium]
LQGIDYFSQWLEHPLHDDYWRQVNIENFYDRVKAAALNIGGWYDIFLYGTIRNYLGLRSRGGSEAARQSRLLVGPWAHITRSLLFMGNLVGDVNFGIGSASQAMDLMGLQLQWFDYWLKGQANGADRWPPARLFVMGANAWQDYADFPPPDSKELSLYLHSQGRANTLHGDGLLSLQPPGEEAPDRFVYDPMNPVPTRGGGLCCSDVYLPGGAFDQRAIEERQDVLVYTSSPLERDLPVMGPVQVRLFVTTSARDTDFTAKLVDVYPEGRAINITDGILRLRHRNGTDREEFAEPGRIYEITIDLWYTAHVFKAGHRIRLEVSSSNFPRFDRNLNTGGPLGAEREGAVAVQHVYHDVHRPSALVLRVMSETGDQR